MDERELVGRLARRHDVPVLVIGDLIVDRYSWGDAERVSPEAPVIVLRVQDREVRLGGAASVASLLRGWDVTVDLVAAVGSDPAASTARRLLSDEEIGDGFVVTDCGRVTTEKERFIGRADSRHPHQILRVDQETTEPIPRDVARYLADKVSVNMETYGAVLISDYAKGVCTPELLQPVIATARSHGIPVLVDPARRDCFQCYAGADIIKPNRIEAGRILGHAVATLEDAEAAARAIAKRYGIPEVVVTLDAGGMLLFSGDTSHHVCSRKRPVYDITGAGDMALAMLGLAAAGGMRAREALTLANVAAGLEVEKWGVARVSLDEVARELRGGAASQEITGGKRLNLGEAAVVANQYRRQGKTVVFTNGCFDLLHVGHVTYLEEARQMGDVLVVAINSDESVRCLKGPARPVIQERDRARMLESLSCVDHVLVFEESTPHRLLEMIQPDVLVKGGTYSVDQVVGREVVESYGGAVRVTRCVPGVSSTSVIEKIHHSENSR